MINGAGGGTFATQWNYDAVDRLNGMKYPGGAAGQLGEQVTFRYDRLGLRSVTGSSPYVQNTEYDAAGRVELRKLGADVLRQDYVYFPWTTLNGQGRLQQIKTGQPDEPTSLQDLRYTYDAVGNVLTIQDWKAGSPQTQTFTYDPLDRLLTASASGGTGGTYPQEVYSYNPIGNLTSKAGVTQWYSDTLHKHAVTHLGGVLKFSYDANGNMTQRKEGSATYDQTWDAENRLATISTAATASFVYDGDGQRVKATVNGVTTVYLGNYYELSGSTTRKYYYAGSQRVAMNANGTLYFLLGDHLGSTAITANGSGGLYAEQRYKPWGETRYTSGTPTPTTYRFTGQREEVGLGSLYFYNARFYSPVVGRFLSADTIVPEPGNPQAFNRYTYSLSNPVRYSDPTGHFSEDEIQKFLGKESWEDVLKLFQEGGEFEGRWGWLAILQEAEYGDNINIEWDTSLLPSDHPQIDEVFSGEFTEGPEGELLILGEEFFLDQMKAAKYGKQYELFTEGRPTDMGSVVAGAFMVVTVDVTVGSLEALALWKSGGNPYVVQALELLNTTVVLPINAFGIALVVDGLGRAPETKLRVPAHLDPRSLTPRQR